MADGGDPGIGQADASEIGLGKFLRAGKQIFQTKRVRYVQLFAITGGDSADERSGAFDRYLLPDNGPNAELECIERPWNPDTRTLRNQTV